MKKVLAFSISILCVILLVGCGSNAGSNTSTDKPYAGAPKKKNLLILTEKSTIFPPERSL